MIKKLNKILIAFFVILSILILQFGNDIKNKAIILAFGLLVMLYLVHYFSKKHNLETEAEIEKIKIDAAKKYSESEDKMATLIASIPSALVYINQKGEFDIYNKKFHSILNVDALNVYDSRIESNFRQMLLDAFLYEKQFIRQEKYNDVNYQVLSIPMTKNNRYNGCMIIMQDITRLLEGEKRQQRFVANASYELQGPIDSIKEMIEGINSDDNLTERQIENNLAQIQIEVARLGKIINTLLLRSQLMEDKLHLEKTEFNLRQFFEGLIYEKRRALHKSNIDVVLNCPSDVMIVGDHFRLSQVFGNLFNNSINYSKNESIKIDCNISRNNWEIKFCDTGSGIPEDVLPHIFDRFYRGEAGHEPYSGKTGLGLAVSKSIINAHGGDIIVESEVGKGTCFTVNIDPTENLY